MNPQIPTRLFHGTSLAFARDIEARGIDMSKVSAGYFGVGFYTAEEFDLAKRNYADFADEDGGAILEFSLAEHARILDLRTPEGFEEYQRVTDNGRLSLSRPDYAAVMTRAGVDGLYDNSFEGVVIYNPSVLNLQFVHTEREEACHSPLRPRL
ncbi:hypothetical protein ACXIUT_19795 [Achromobacter denitrificans]|jgi:hypothetical protein